MSGFNDGKTAQEVAEIIAADRHLSTTHKVKSSKSEARRRIEQLRDEKILLDDDTITLGSKFSVTDYRYTSENQLNSARANAKKSHFKEFVI